MLENAIKELPLQSADEAWLVVDRDQWTTESLKRVHAWCQKTPNAHLALSNPKFEFWLLLPMHDSIEKIYSQLR
jgi:hypothetical protein